MSAGSAWNGKLSMTKFVWNPNTHIKTLPIAKNAKDAAQASARWSIVDERVDQWELLMDDADEADEARNTARRFYRLSDPIGVDDIFEKYGDEEVFRLREGYSVPVTGTEGLTAEFATQ